MRMTKVFKSGNSQAVRLPKAFQLHSDEVEIFRRDGDIVIREVPKSLAKAFEVLTHFTPDFYAQGREDSLPQEREF